MLSIGGLDPTGGAGIAGDLKTFAAHGVHGAAVVAAVTAQNHLGVTAIAEVAPDLVRAQLAAVLGQVAPRAAKTGMLLAPAIVTVVADALRDLGAPLVVDPVLAASAGGPSRGRACSTPSRRTSSPSRRSSPRTLTKPRSPSAAPAPPRPISLRPRVPRSRPPGPCVVAGGRGGPVEGGHGTGDAAVDVLVTDAGAAFTLAAPRLATPDGHGSGCALAASIAVRLARGDDLLAAVTGAKGYLHRALSAAVPLGRGRGPVHHDVAADATAPVVEVRGPF